jgi:hypothetical protein
MFIQVHPIQIDRSRGFDPPYPLKPRTALALPCQQLLLAAPVAKDATKGRPIFEYSDVPWNGGLYWCNEIQWDSCAG